MSAEPGGGAVEAPTLTLEELLGAPALEALAGRYGADDLRGDALYQRVQREWHQLSLAEARRLLEAGLVAPERLPAVEVDRGGRRVAVYGVIHGMVGGDNPAYRELVQGALAALPRVVFENGLSLFYRARGRETMPDFAVLGVRGSFAIGVRVGLEFPLLILELLAELLRLRRSSVGGEALPILDYDPRYHALDPELRRGVEPDPPLPSRLEIGWAMPRWDRGGLLAMWRDPSAIVPRSLFMAGYAAGCAERGGEEPVALVVGDLHTMEVVRFLEDPAWEAHALFQAGRRAAAAGRVAFVAAKVVHLLCAGLGGCMILLPVITLAAWLIVG